jgi:AraC family transcriptional activator of tynA and feaB
MERWAELLQRGFGPRLVVEEGGRGALRRVVGPGGMGALVAAGAPVRLRVEGAAGTALVALTEGAGLAEQDAHTWELLPGTLLLLDLGLPSTLALHTSFRLVGLRVLTPPRSFVLGTLDPTAHAVDRLLFNTLAALATPEDVDPHPAVVAAACALLPACSAYGATTPASDGVRLRRADRYIEANLADLALTPERVAEAQRVSRRWLDKAFAARGQTVAAAIHERRLLAASRLLDSEASVLEVALRCGFPSASALSHAFRKRFGVSPSGWRRAGEDGPEEG